MIPGQPALELAMGVGAPVARDLVDLRMIERELEYQPIGIVDIDRAAVAVLEYVGVRRLDPRGGDALFDIRLRFRVHGQRNVVKRRGWHFRSEFLLILWILELEERQRAAVAYGVERVAIRAHFAE